MTQCLVWFAPRAPDSCQHRWPHPFPSRYCTASCGSSSPTHVVLLLGLTGPFLVSVATLSSDKAALRNAPLPSRQPCSEPKHHSLHLGVQLLSPRGPQSTPHIAHKNLSLEHQIESHPIGAAVFWFLWGPTPVLFAAAPHPTYFLCLNL